jgi:hypothetical protein
MDATFTPSENYPHSSIPSGSALATAILAAAWLILVLLLGSARAFVTPPGEPPLGIAVAFAAPLLIFFVALAWRPVRELMSSLDLRVISAIQGWRFAGLAFIALYAHSVLPGSFAWPAGLGDIAIGVTAPWIVSALLRRPNFAASSTFVWWNVLGMLDLITAVSTGAANSVFASGIAGEISTRPMATLPLVLIPVYFVPILFMLHVAALLQARKLRQEAPRRA